MVAALRNTCAGEQLRLSSAARSRCHTFEVKKFSDAENIRSVYESAAHSRWAHFSYLVAEVPSSDYEFPERFVTELERFNIGLIFMWKEKDGWQFEEQEWESDRLNPEPEELNA